MRVGNRGSKIISTSRPSNTAPSCSENCSARGGAAEESRGEPGGRGLRAAVRVLRRADPDSDPPLGPERPDRGASFDVNRGRAGWQPYGGGPLTEPGSTSARGVTWNLAASASNAPIVVPDRIGRFRVVRLLGRGNFLVFLAHDDQNDTEVAIKVARTGDSFSRRPLMSLAEEAQRLSALDHPGIVKIHEFVTPPSDAILEQEGGPGGFIVLEYVPGLNLEELFRQTSMAPARLAQIAAEIADAIHHAHMLGLVHRDLKPSNVLIDAHGHPRVCDFGLAIDEEIQRLRRGEVAGTLPYMAPNRFAARPIAWTGGRTSGPWE